MKYYLSRMFNHEPELSGPLSDANFVSIGFGDFIRDTSTINSIKSNPSLENLKLIAIDKWGYTIRSLSDLARFLAIKPSDWVIVPIWGSFYIAEVLEAARPLTDYDNELAEVRTKIPQNINDYDIGFVIKVKWFKRSSDNKYEIGRDEFADKALTSRLKARQTCLDISDLEDNILSAWKSFNENIALNPNTYLLESASQNLYEILTKPSSPFNPRKFEGVIEDLMDRMHATNIEKPKVTGEGDADIMATFEPIKHIVYIQAKYFEKDTQANEWAVTQIRDFSNRQEISSIDEYTTAFWVVSSAKDFSDEAKALAKKESIRLVSGLELSRLLLQVGLGDFAFKSSKVVAQ